MAEDALPELESTLHTAEEVPTEVLIMAAPPVQVDPVHSAAEIKT